MSPKKEHIKYYLRSPQFFLQFNSVKKSIQTGKRFLATQPRSGTNYLYSLLNSTFHLKEGLRADYTHGKGINGREKWIFPYETRVVNYFPHLYQSWKIGEFNFLKKYLFVLSHYPAVRDDFIFKASTLRPVILIRDILDCSKSYLHFEYENSELISQNSFIENELKNLIKFQNHWHEFSRNREILLIKYEELKKSPEDVLKRIFGHWTLNIEDQFIIESVNSCTRTQMLDKIPSNIYSANKRITENQNRSGFSDQNKERIKRILNESLKDSFGYTY